HEELVVRQHRSADFVEVVGAKHITHRGLNKVPQLGLGREKIAGSSDGFNHCGCSSLVVDVAAPPSMCLYIPDNSLRSAKLFPGLSGPPCGEIFLLTSSITNQVHGF